MTEKKDGVEQKLSFQAEVSRLLDIVANSLYSEREIFLRELISNAADACEKLRYLSISNEKLLEKDKDFKINILLSKKTNLISIEDNGLGMSKQELIDNLGTIARSGTSKFLENIKKDKKQSKDLSAIGQFGVGFYSSYMVADKVLVESKKSNEQESWSWESDGKNNYIIKKSSKKTKGTIVNLYLKKDSNEFLDSLRIKEIVKKYSNYIQFPIFLKNDEEKNDEEKINEGEALWLKDKKNIKDDDYKQFYNNISFNFDEPIKTIHFNAEGVLNYTSLLYLPSKQPFDLFNPERKNKIKLYVQKVFISDDCENIIPPWLRFIPGVVDSQDISLNISREMLQNNPVIIKIKQGLTNKIIKELKIFSEKEPEKYLDFWKNFGVILKEGLYEHNEFHNDLLPLLRFKNSINENWMSLNEYLSKIEKDQKEIYYFANAEINNKNLMNSPQLETFIEKKIPVLIMTDPVDEFWLPNIGKYKEKEFKSITKGKLNIKKNTTKKNDTKEINDLINILKEELKDSISDVRISERLVKSPLLLIADESGLDINMEKIMKMHNQTMENNKKILEINPNHEMIKKLSNSLTKLNHKVISKVIMDHANILDGNTITDPSSYLENLTELFIKN